METSNYNQKTTQDCATYYVSNKSYIYIDFNKNNIDWKNIK